MFDVAHCTTREQETRAITAGELYQPIIHRLTVAILLTNDLRSLRDIRYKIISRLDSWRISSVASKSPLLLLTPTVPLYRQRTALYQSIQYNCTRHIIYRMDRAKDHTSTRRHRDGSGCARSNRRYCHYGTRLP